MSAGRISCGAVITRSTTLTADVGPCPNSGIIIGADNIMLNLNGHTVFGVPGPGSGNDAGIRLPNRSGVRVTGQPGSSGRKGTVTGFDAGVFVNGGSSNTIENLTVRDNVGPESTDAGGFATANLGDGIVVFTSPDNRIVNNQLLNNGRYDGIAVLGRGSDRNTIQGNVIRDTLGAEESSYSFYSGAGIIVNNFLDLSDRGFPIYNNSVIGNTVLGSAGSGISSIGSVNSVVSDNTVEDNGVERASQTPLDQKLRGGIPANGIGAAKGPEIFEPLNMLIARNNVNRNGLDGIIVERSVDGVTIQENRSTYNGWFGIILDLRNHDNKVIGNATGYNGFIDLVDGAEDETCDNNVWFGNTWGPLQPLAAEFGLTSAYYPDFQEPKSEYL
ncbi:MAG: right-handed parallel beta-helix repeat-containing protein [Actinobacteria bacterium]|nr:right-handed parallel beta-helix repeat-containing protein [Actinomycetota bacterium]